jgi:hypothetical protein
MTRPHLALLINIAVPNFAKMASFVSVANLDVLAYEEVD